MNPEPKDKSFSYSFFQENVAFFVCLLLAITVWANIKLSDNYSVRSYYNINYQLPSNFDFVSSPPATIDFDGVATGWSLLKGHVADQERVITIQTEPSQGYQNIQRGELINHIAEIIDNSDIKIDNLSIESIQLEFRKRASKTVPIKLIGTIEAHQGYIISAPVSIIPPEIKISGANSVIDTIDVWPTLPIGMQLIKGHYEQNIDLVQLEHINMDISSIKVEALADQKTQKQMRIQVKSPYPKIRLVPDFVDVAFNTGIGHFNAIDSSQFLIEVSIDTSLHHMSNIVPLIIRKHPSYIENIRLTPKVVEYLLID